MKRKNSIRTLVSIISIVFFIALIIIVFSDESLARPGGGHSYKGGSRSSGSSHSFSRSGGSGGLGGGIFVFVGDSTVWIIIIIAIVVIAALRKANAKDETLTSSPTSEILNMNNETIDTYIEEFKRVDANFSKVLFLDFVSSLYHKYYAYFGKPQFSFLTPFLSEKEIANAQTNNFNKREINEIVIGNMRISDFNNYQTGVAITVDIDANYTVTVNDKRTRYIVTERWLFNRNSGVSTLSPEKMRDVSCPSCGAAANFTDSGKCQHCGTFVAKGEMQWFLKSKKILTQEAFLEKNLVSYAEEQGTDLPTIYQFNINKAMQRFSAQHAERWDVLWDNFKDTIVEPYFLEIYTAWSNQKWQTVRHLLSDRLFESNSYWQDTYKRNKLINKLDDIKIYEIDIVRIDLDKYYESITVRIYASCFDYVIDNTGKLIGGSKRSARKYSEYWTFIKGTGITAKPTNLKICPNCGAPADKMGQAAVCEYCGSKISTGDFSWILSMITQDDVYQG